MSLKTRSVCIQEAMDACAAAVELTYRDGRLIEATVVAQQILHAIPDCDLSIANLADQIARLASAKGVSVEFGRDPSSPISI